MSETPRERFEDELRRWAEEPPRTPPEVAARRILARLDQPRTARPLPALRPVWALAFVLALALAVGWWGLRGPAPDATDARTVSVTTPALPTLDDGVVLIWLDAETPLYLSLQTREHEEGDPT